MRKEDKVYRDLQKYLNKQPVGFPGTRSGIELKILKRFFTPDEARLAMRMDYKLQTAQSIYKTVKETGLSLEEIINMLDDMLKKGAIESIEKEGIRYFHLIPFVVGIYEAQVDKLTPDFIDEYEEYSNSKAFGLEFINTGLPQFRTIPVRESITVNHSVTSYDRLNDIIHNTGGPIVVLECICRKKANIQGNPCHQTNRLETCLAFGDIAKNCILQGIGREINREDALEICRQNEADGLILQPSNSQKVGFICACCACCCGVLKAHRALTKPANFWNTNYYAKVNPDTCTGCGICESRCQLKAIMINESLNVAQINRDKCLGCGNCVAFCPTESISLNKKETEHVPPAEYEDIYDVIKEKRGNLGKLKIAARILFKR